MSRCKTVRLNRLWSIYNVFWCIFFKYWRKNIWQISSLTKKNTLIYTIDRGFTLINLKISMFTVYIIPISQLRDFNCVCVCVCFFFYNFRFPSARAISSRINRNEMASEEKKEEKKTCQQRKANKLFMAFLFLCCCYFCAVFNVHFHFAQIKKEN